jgi:hypothetical protein
MRYGSAGFNLYSPASWGRNLSALRLSLMFFSALSSARPASRVGTFHHVILQSKNNN